ncbi:MAG: NAD(+)/NADH kinase [bacterium]
MKRIGLIVNHDKPTAAGMACTILQHARGLGLELLANAETVAAVGGGQVCAVESFPGLVDAVVVLGGDGTMLHAAHRLQGSGVPLMGLNLGDLGYLTSVEATRIEEALVCLREDRFTISRRAALTSTIERANGERALTVDALNDLVVSRGASGRAVRLELSLDGVFVTTYICDGIIVSTPTGSTAYALSAGGPIVMPGTAALVVAVICPHTLSSRPLVVPDSTLMVIRVAKTAAPLVASVDGQDDFILQQGERIEVRRSPRDVPVIHLPGYDAYSVLDRKLGWGGR